MSVCLLACLKHHTSRPREILRTVCVAVARSSDEHGVRYVLNTFVDDIMSSDSGLYGTWR